ncbi:MAG: IS66 family transposase [Acidobacteria bacterium]|nr:IS66 family transposase [Acidobacteriota bacterium]
MAEPDSVLTQLLDARDVRVAELEIQLRQRDARIEQLQQRVAELEQRLAELERTGKRQATPFARRQRKANPKRPGRKAGQGPFTSRARPTPEQVTETKEQALEACPFCGGPVTDVRDHEQFVVDLPEVQPTVTRYRTHSGQCARCGRRVRSRHPEQISQATGAAGVVIGPRAKALAADLKHRLGVPYGKVAEMLRVGWGLPVSRGGLCQADARLARQARPVYAELLDLIRQSAVAHADETGWRIGTLAAWLWVFTNRDLTVYTIATGRGHEVVVKILGEAFAGILVSDCFTAYDHQALAAWLKQKCVGHLLKDLSELNESKTGAAVRFARDVTAALRAALTLRDQKRTLPVADFAAQAAQLEGRLDALIATTRQLTDPDNARFARRLRKHRQHLLRFLYVDGLDATNNQAERMVRPAVITRKTGGCNRTTGGAETHSILASILVTCRQQGFSIRDSLVKIQRNAGSTLKSLAPPLLDTS